MNRHLTYHQSSNTKSYKCDACGAEYQNKLRLECHIKIEHNGESKFRCEKCNALFTEKGNLSQHIDSIHEKLKGKFQNIFFLQNIH